MDEIYNGLHAIVHILFNHLNNYNLSKLNRKKKISREK